MLSNRRGGRNRFPFRMRKEVFLPVRLIQLILWVVQQATYSSPHSAITTPKRGFEPVPTATFSTFRTTSMDAWSSTWCIFRSGDAFVAANLHLSLRKCVFEAWCPQKIEKHVWTKHGYLFQYQWFRMLSENSLSECFIRCCSCKLSRFGQQSQ